MNIPQFLQITTCLIAIMVGCCCNVLTLELIAQADKSCGTMITFLQFCTVGLFGLPNQLTTKSNFPYFGLKERTVPIHIYLFMVLMFVSSSVMNNAVFAYDISLPLNTIFRSSAMICTVILNVIIFGKRYSFLQIVSVIMVTIGVIIVTLSTLSPGDMTVSPDQTSAQVIGITILSIGLVISSSLGLVQEWTRDRYGKNSEESRFYYVCIVLYCILLYCSISIYYICSMCYQFLSFYFYFQILMIQ